MKRIILDRDGVINEDSETYIKSPDEWELIAGSGEAIAKLNRHHYTVIVVTNQSGIARGLYNRETLDAIHAKMAVVLAQFGAHVDKIYLCPHHPDEHCHCRKPRAGLLEQAAKEYPLTWTDTYFIGDKRSDVDAARTVGCRPLLLRTGKGAQTLLQWPELVESVPVFDHLNQAVAFILTEDA